MNANRADDEAGLSPGLVAYLHVDCSVDAGGRHRLMWLLPSMVKEPATSPKMTVVAWPASIVDAHRGARVAAAKEALALSRWASR